MKRGFTLIELIQVITWLAFLALVIWVITHFIIKVW